ncbi:MAG: divergent polysaccharide deacetylase family protein [Devosia sp.]|nr:divergent polysaccharide deacetylase family protein [Devosia sp.]
MSDLGAPLSRRKARQANAAPPAGFGRSLPIARVAFGALLLILLGVFAWVLVVDDPDGGRPSTTVDIVRAANLDSPGGLAASDAGPEAATGPTAPAVLEAEAPADSDAPPDDPTLVADLVEETEFGQIPRMSPMGVTPFQTYARPSDTPATAAGKPMVALVVSGLGINLNGTLEAIQKLPDTVTLAFAPYGKSLDRSVGAARAEGHEVFLEVPLEPFDYPDNDPGPDTLLTGQPPRDNLSKLFHVMSRFGGYVGVVNNMGARFTASAADFGPVMEELGARGLGYLDDGSSNRSLAPQLARANRVPYGRVNALVDANPARGPILAQLAALEAEARKSGSAIGIVSALPVSIDTVAEWARGLADKGIEIVPASALMKDQNG